MAQIQEDIEKYKHSPIHYAIARQDHASLKHILSELPHLPKGGEVVTEEEAILAEQLADKVSAAINRRDVPNRETPLHLAARLRDAAAVEMLMVAGVDDNLHNEQGWTAVQEAVYARDEGIAMIIYKYHQPLAWAKWSRRLVLIMGTMRRMRDFYMEITFNFESSVIPFITRIAPSDTYKIWKRGSNLRADMTLAGFDGFKIKRADQSLLFLGDGTEDGKIPPGSLLMLTHKDKEVSDALEGAGAQLSDAEVAQEVAAMSQTELFRPGLDVTQAELIPQLTWRRQQKTETVGPWKARIYDMQHVQVTALLRQVPGAMKKDNLSAPESKSLADQEDQYAGILTEEERRQLESALNMDTSGTLDRERNSRSCDRNGGIQHERTHRNYEGDLENVNGGVCTSPQNGMEHKNGSQDKKKGWFGWGKRASKVETDGSSVSTCKAIEHADGEASPTQRTSSSRFTKHSSKEAAESRSSLNDNKENGTCVARESENGEGRAANRETKDGQNLTSSRNGHITEYKRGIKPVLWLTQDFPMKTEELLPLLDIMADRVKAVRRLRQVLTTKLPFGMFPVKVAIPVVPTVRVVVTFNKIEELSTMEEFVTPPSSPAHFSDFKSKDNESTESSSSWTSWIRGGSKEPVRRTSSLHEDCVEDIDPFLIPGDYTWIDKKEKKRRSEAKRAKARKAVAKKSSSKASEAAAGKGPES